MHCLPEPSLHWTDHYVKYGFCVLPGLLNPSFVARAHRTVVEKVAGGLPPESWTTTALTPQMLAPHRDASAHPVLSQVYDDPAFRGAIDAMFGSAQAWNGERQMMLFANPWDPTAKPQLQAKGHLDFEHCPIPTLGNGFMFQAALSEMEPYGGNTTLYPGTHRHVIAALQRDPDWRYPQGMDEIPPVTPWEFVGQPGDVLFFHHLMLYGRNPCAGSRRMPRICLHGQVLQRQALRRVDPADPANSPWARSLVLDRPREAAADEDDRMRAWHQRKRAG